MALLGYGVLAALVAYAAFLAGTLIWRRRRKLPLFPNRWWVGSLIDFASAMLAGVLAALIILLAFGGYYLGNAFLYLLCVAGIVLFIKPTAVYLAVKAEKLLDKRHAFLAGAFVLIASLEAFAFNARAYKDHAAVSSYDFSDASISLNGTSFNPDGSALFDAYSSFELLAGSASAERIYFSFATDESLEVIVRTRGYRSGELAWSGGPYSLNPAVKEANYVPVLGPYDAMDFFFSFSWDRLGTGDGYGAVPSVIISKIAVNEPICFYFSLGRFASLALLALVLAYLPSFVRKKGGAPREIARKGEFGVLIASAAVFVGVLIYALLNRSSFFQAYPFAKPVEDYDIYAQMFDAFRKGRLSLDVDQSLRLWDHAYCNGQCYSYYGVLPVFLLYFPLYFLTGMIPTIALAQILGAIMEVGAFLILLLEICKVFAKKMSWQGLLFILVVGLFASLSLNLVSFKSYYISAHNPCVEGIYHLPIIFGLWSLDLFLYFALRAYGEKKRRTLHLALSGLFFVFIMASRPDLFLSLVFALPLFLKLLLDKSEKTSKRLWAFAPMAAVLIVGATLICAYNYGRFGSIFEYGQRYQNTISDQSDLSIKGEQILPALFHYFFNPWQISDASRFPFIAPTNPVMTSDAKDFSFYLNSYAGVFSLPLFWSLFLLPFSWRETHDRWLASFALLIPAAMALLAIVTYSFAGLCPRYMIEMYHLAVIGSVIALILFASKEKAKAPRLIPVLLAVGFVSVFIAFNYAFWGFDGLEAGDLGGLLLKVREMFGYFSV